MIYKWETRGDGELLMLSLPLHRELLSKCYTRLLPAVSFKSLDGALEGVVGHKWGLSVKGIEPRWHSKAGIDHSSQPQLVEALKADVSALQPITTPSTYFHGKALARAARLALIAEELQHFDLVEKVTSQRHQPYGAPHL